MQLVAWIIVNGISAFAFYALITIGLTLVFSVMRTLNFAHGEIYMLGAYGMWILYVENSIPFLFAVLITVIIVGILGLLLEKFIFRAFRNKPMSGLISAVGLVFILQVLVGQIWGLGLNKPVPYAYRGVVKPLGVPICYHDLIVILVSVGLMIILWIFLNRIRLGQGMRAVSQDSIAASLQGISINKMGLVAMGTGCAFAGLAGALSAPLVTVNPYMGGTIILKAFLIIIVGGVGSIGGTILASLLFAFLDTVITRLADSTIANMIGLLLMLGILTFRPKGLLGRE